MSEAPKKRGPQKGAKYERLVEKVCANTVDCPLEGKPFLGTAKAQYCDDTKCGQRVRRRRRQEGAKA